MSNSIIQFKDIALQQKNDTAANLASENPFLEAGEIAIESDTNKFKFGDGSTAWNNLSYANNAISSTFKYGLYTLSADQTSNLVAGKHIEFDTVQGSLDNLSTGSGQANGVITLAGGKTYKITGTASLESTSSGYGEIGIYDVTNSVYVGVVYARVTTANPTNAANSGNNIAIITPSTDVEIEARIQRTSSNWTTIFSNAAYMLIEEYGGY